MKRFGIVLTTGFLLGFSAFASTVDKVIDQADVLAWAGTGGDIDPRGLAALSDGRLVYFEDDYKLPSSKEDAVLLIDPAQNGNDRFTVIASEPELKALASTNACCIFASDVVTDEHDNVYVLATEYNTSYTTVNNFVARVPYQNGTFGDPELVTDVFDGGMSGAKTWHRLAVQNDVLYILFDNRDDDDDLTGVHGSNGIYSFDLTGNLPGDTNDLEIHASYQAVGAALSPAIQPGEDVGLWQIRADNAGNLFGFVYEHDGDQAGDLLKIATDGTVSVFLSRQQAEKETGWLDAFEKVTNLAIDPSTQHFYFFESGSGNEDREILYEFDENGSHLGQASAYQQILDGGGNVSSTFTTIDSNALAVDGNGVIYLFLSGESTETLVSIDPASACSETTSYIWPNGEPTVAQVDSPYGPRKLFSGGGRYDFHRGIDLDMPIGTDVYAVADGVVTSVSSKISTDCDDVDYTEWKVVVRHGHCPPYVYATYIHLSQSYVSEGDLVTQGDPNLQVSNAIGASGRSFSCYEHLHFEMRVGGVYQALCHNPLEFLPYTDTTPDAPVLAGVNSTAEGRQLYFTYTADVDELDLNGVRVEWGTDTYNWDWPVFNKANGPAQPTGMDHPVTSHGGGVVSTDFPETVVSTSDHGMIIAGLDASISNGTISVVDTQGTASSTAVAFTMPELTLTTNASEAVADAGDDVDFTFTVTNTGGSSVDVDLSAVSARQHDIDLDPADASFTLDTGAGKSRQITITVHMSNSLPDGVGDSVLVKADLGTALDVVSLFRVNR